ncbi:MAG: xanthan lyase [Prevotella sp.]|nr:xanthan lyase [Prevotella sp.]
MYKRFIGKWKAKRAIGTGLISFLSAVLVPLALHAQQFPEYKGEPWVRNTSRPFSITHGLDGRHLSLWASHGRYYDQTRWKWQRPPLFCTTEDLFTQTIVIPYLIPMLENAGAIVFTPRERDWQRYEVIVDNDMQPSMLQSSRYEESNNRNAWQSAPYKGFAMHQGAYRDGENPFEAGTARMAEATKSKNRASQVVYQPNIPETGNYAVYVSYQTVPASIDDARYTVWHQGQSTEFRVNQRMGGSTWVYLGTFTFDAGCNDLNRVVITNVSDHKGMVTTDAVRFGGGMGNVARGGSTSGMPRCLEGARYAAQWAGMPYNVYSPREGTNDYADDINVRSLMTNYMAGRSVFAPDSVGLGVPIEMSLGVHSDAGFTETGRGVYGTLSICTTGFGDKRLASGLSRDVSKDLATDLLNNTTQDLQARFGEWTRRKLYDRNYSESRVPIVPSAILETLSHQNFGDMRYGLDPNFRFTIARSIYKTLLRYVNVHHGRSSVVTPLAPNNFHIEFTGKQGEVRLSWQGIIDGQERTSAPTGYVLYIARGNGGFDNGTPLRGTSCNYQLEPGVLYNFYVRATNDGGQSFPTEMLSALYNPQARQTVMIVNGFRRLSSPAISTTGLGFDIDEDPGVTYGRTAEFVGRQRAFDPTFIGLEDSTGLGFSTDELQGHFIAGNEFNYVRTHAKAIAAMGRFSIVSASAQAVEEAHVPLNRYQAVDLILGLERNDGHSLVTYKTFSPALQRQLELYTKGHGNLLVSGAYIGTDMDTPVERQFLANVLKVQPAGRHRDANNVVRGLGMAFDFYHQLNEAHYAATSTDVLMPASGGTSFPSMVYANGTCAAVAYNGNDYHAFVMGFPLECVIHEEMQRAIMYGIMNFLIPN